MKHNHIRLIIAIITTALVAVPSVASAAAPPVAASPTQVSIATGSAALPRATAEQVTAVSAALDAKGVPAFTTLLSRTIRTTYTLPSGSTVVVERPRTTSGIVAPQFSVGAGWGIYIYLNPTDQQVVAAGGAAGLAVLICGSTALIGCAAATAALAAAATWIARRGGICPKRLQIRFFLGAYTFKCVNP